jgi:hypothetical protein
MHLQAKITRTPAPHMTIQPDHSLEALRPVIKRFGDAAGLSDFQLDEQGSAAVALSTGARLELEYVVAADRLLAFVEVLGDPPEDATAWAELARQNLRLMAAQGFSLCLGQLQGRDRLLLMNSFPGSILTEEILGNTLVQLIETARELGRQRHDAPDAPSDDSAAFYPNAFRV